MARTREWLKFGGLVTLTVVLAAAVVATAREAPRAAAAQEQGAALEALAPPQATAVPAAARPLADLSESFTAVAQLVQPAVVFIQAQAVEQGGRDRVQVPRGFEDFFRIPDQGPRLRRGSGTGFLISKDGHIITNNHVVDGATSLRVRLFDKREFDAEVVGRDPETDVAVIKIKGNDLPSLTLGNSDSVRVGEWVLAVGNPLGEAFSFTVTAGIVSAKGRLLAGLRQSDYTIMDFIQTDAVINPGNSGGPLVNVRGQVVGVNSAIASENGFYQGYGFAIPVNLARVVANQLIADGRVHRAVLGIQIRDANENDAAYTGVADIRGVVVVDFPSDDSPAKAAGIQPEDLIVELDGKPVEYVAQLQQAVGFKRPGETVRVTVVRRGGERRTFTVKLTAAPADRLLADREPETADRVSVPDHKSKLGITVTEVTGRASSQLGSDNIGPLVTEVDLESPAQGQLCPQAAANCGFGDVITHVNGRRVHSVQEFEAALRSVRAGDIVSLRLYNPSPPAPGARLARIRVPE
jgi:serine protease Do